MGVALFLIHNLSGLKNFGKHDRDMTKIFLDKFPLVRPEFYSLNWREQQAENNQEIHELKKTVEYLTSVIEELKKKNG